MRTLSVLVVAFMVASSAARIASADVTDGTCRGKLVAVPQGTHVGEDGVLYLDVEYFCEEAPPQPSITIKIDNRPAPDPVMRMPTVQPTLVQKAPATKSDNIGLAAFVLALFAL
jgi:hypothetical protein